MLLLLRDMHAACVEAAEDERQSVCQLARMAGFLDFVPTAEGLRPVEGACWDAPGMRSGSGRMREETLEKHRRWVQEHDGKPPAPDWSQLQELRDKLQAEAEERKKALASKGRVARPAAARQALALANQPEAAAEAAAVADQPEAAAEAPAVADQPEPQPKPIKGFLDILQNGQGLSVEETLDVIPDMEGADRHGIELNAIQMQDLEAGRHALVSALSRHELKALLQPAQMKFTSSQKPSEASKAMKQQDAGFGWPGLLRKIDVLLFRGLLWVAFWIAFEPLGPPKTSFWCRRGAIFQKFVLCLIRFTFGLSWDGFGIVSGPVFGWLLEPWTLQNEPLVQARCEFPEILVFFYQMCFWIVLGFVLGQPWVQFSTVFETRYPSK